MKNEEIVEVSEAEMVILVEFERILQEAQDMKAEIFDTIGLGVTGREDIIRDLGSKYMGLRNKYSELLSKYYQEISGFSEIVQERLMDHKKRLTETNVVLQRQICKSIGDKERQ